MQQEIPQKKESRKSFSLDPRIRISLGWLLQGIALFLGFAFYAHLIYGRNDQAVIESFLQWGVKKSGTKVSNWLGFVGAFVSYYGIYLWWGITAFLFLPGLFLMGVRMVTRKIWPSLSILRVIVATIFLVLWFNILLGCLYTSCPTLFILAYSWEGVALGGVAYSLGAIFQSLLGYGTFLFLFIALAIFAVICCNITSFPLSFGNWFRYKRFKDKIDLDNESSDNPNLLEQEDGNSKKKINNLASCYVAITGQEVGKVTSTDESPNPSNDIAFEIVPSVSTLFSHDIPKNPKGAVVHLPLHALRSENYDPTLDLSHYSYPPLSLLAAYEQAKSSVTEEELAIHKNNIVQTLHNFKINIAKIKATIGPTVTLYEIVPEAGVKVSRIKNLEDDIALSLAALGIRMIAPIPGKGTIGIEVPNKNRELVPLQEILSSEKFLKGKMDLPVVLGKSISNDLMIADLTRMPHLLIAGATGQGKSVGLNVLLTSLIYKKHPSQLKLVLVDPKKVELSLYNRLENHFLAKLPTSEEAIITETKKVVHTLHSLCIEMDNRYELLKEASTRNIKEYNEKFVKRILNPREGHRFLPYIVLVIDEFADMIMTAGKEIEIPIARLAQLARAIGIHLVLATQRPSVNVITGTIKANFPVRISYKVSSRIDSRTILDVSGAEQLVGNGDMLLSMNSDIIRLQGPFLDTEEVERVCTYVGAQLGYGSAYLLPTYDEEDKEDNASVDLNVLDPLFEEAARLIVMHQQGSTSLIQRKLKLGYNRSGRIMDQLEATGIVGPFEGSKARAVFITDEISLNELLAGLKNKK